MNDLFGHVPQKGELFREPQTYAAPPVATVDTIRVKMQDLLAEARACQTLTWTAQQLRSNTAACLRYAEWLKNGEGDRYIEDYKVEMDRLGAPIEQVAPNWRDRWGFDWRLGMEPDEIARMERVW